ncbi:hypothetical protein M514_02105 [Trichuris suis]|uniref:Uncharacterized protein n=1 Tax=Trichuris suis TaxID=68888 RepID=A0A085NM88_9BILA|nr:hypothetical protein M513_02105 [Trichuris suis]KFD70584.1 hypothetical protein M514_02105 [Trichuris suis]KHJ47385.1 hypothetical protein D918_02245 [Trichuris suis]
MRLWLFALLVCLAVVLFTVEDVEAKKIKSKKSRSQERTVSTRKEHKKKHEHRQDRERHDRKDKDKDNEKDKEQKSKEEEWHKRRKSKLENASGTESGRESGKQPKRTKRDDSAVKSSDSVKKHKDIQTKDTHVCSDQCQLKSHDTKGHEAEIDVTP